MEYAMKLMYPFLSVLLFLSLLFCAACGTKPPANTDPTTPDTDPITDPITEATTEPPVTEAPKTITICCVGDSITEGVGSSSSSQFSYPAQLQNMLGKGYRVINCGKSKATAMDSSSPYWNTNGIAYNTTVQYRTALRVKGDIYLVMLGTNDAKLVTKTNEKSMDDYREAMEALFSAIEEATPDAEIIVVSSPYRFEDAARQKNQEEAIYPLQKELAEKHSYRFLDLFSYTKEIVTGGKTINSDKLHFTDEGYRLLAEFCFNALTEN